MSPPGERIAGGQASGEHLRAAKRLQGRVQPLVPAGPRGPRAVRLHSRGRPPGTEGGDLPPAPGVGRAGRKGRRPACGCWLGLGLGAYTAAQTCPGSQKGAWEGRASLRVSYTRTEQPESSLPDTVGTRGGSRRDTLLGNQPQRSRVSLFAPGSPLWAWSRCSSGGWEGSWGEGGLAARLVGMGLSGPPPSFWSAPRTGLGERGTWERGGGALLGMCLPPAKAAPWSFTKQADRPP